MAKEQLKLILEAISFIENNLQNPITVQDICAQAPYSPWQFQRLFRAYVGDSIGEYMRARRLTLAAEELMNSLELRVLDIAIAAQFGSQEAFARAFKSQFSVTPLEIRKDPAYFRLNKKMPTTLDSINHLQQSIQREPQIVNYNARSFIGIEATILSPLDKNPDYAEITPALWKKFNLRRKEIPNRMRGPGYGIAISEQGNMLESHLTYLASVEVPMVEAIPPGMRSLTMQAQSFALFDKTEHGERSRLTIDYIYGVWLPNSGYKRAEGHDYEVFGPAFNLVDGSSVSIYCLPITKDV